MATTGNADADTGTQARASAEASSTSTDAEASPGHEHRLAQRSEWPWLPHQNCGHLAPHPYCPDCGEVKAMGTGKALDKGGVVNVIATLKRKLERDGYRMTDVQRRLIMKKVNAQDVDDTFTLTRERQIEMLADIVADYVAIHRDTAEDYLRSC